MRKESVGRKKRLTILLGWQSELHGEKENVQAAQEMAEKGAENRQYGSPIVVLARDT